MFLRRRLYGLVYATHRCDTCRGPRLIRAGRNVDSGLKLRTGDPNASEQLCAEPDPPNDLELRPGALLPFTLNQPRIFKRAKRSIDRGLTDPEVLCNRCLLYEGERGGILLVQSEADERGQYLTIRDVQSPKSIGLVDQRDCLKNLLRQLAGIEPDCLGLPVVGSDRVGSMRRTAAHCYSSGNRKPVEATFHLRSAQTSKGSIDSEGASFVHSIRLVDRVKGVSKLVTSFAYADEKPGAATPGFFSPVETPMGSSTPPWKSAWPRRTCAAADR